MPQAILIQKGAILEKKNLIRGDVAAMDVVTSPLILFCLGLKYAKKDQNMFHSLPNVMETEKHQKIHVTQVTVWAGGEAQGSS